MVLTYLRMGSAPSDYAFRICSLEEIVRQAVRKYSQMFIMTRTRLHLEIQNQKILTDEKWLTFVIEQILSNAVKYARGGEISIYTEEKTLVISDNGIGIAEEDLPRIFEKGFTGYNGRANKKSTGIGLYLCKTIIDRLHHTIWIESKPEKYQEPIAQGGSNVSGGQKQRLSIARAIAIQSVKDLENLQQRNQTIIYFLAGIDQSKMLIHLNYTAARKNKYGKFHVCAMEMKHRNHGGHCRT